MVALQQLQPPGKIENICAYLKTHVPSGFPQATFTAVGVSLQFCLQLTVTVEFCHFSRLMFSTIHITICPALLALVESL